jgi:hypothetical protein
MPEFTRPDLRWRPDFAAIRQLIRRSRWPRLLLALALALSAGALLDQARRDAVTAENSWTPAADVWVMTADLEAGVTIGPVDVVARSLPSAALPRDPVRESPVGLRLRDGVAAGEILRLGRIADSSAGVLASQLPAGSAGLQLPGATTHLGIGDVIDLYALLTGERVATGAEVIAINDGLPTVAIATADLPAVVRTFTTGDVVPVVVG